MITAWLIGSADLGGQEVAVNAAPVVGPDGTCYLYDAVAGRSLLSAVQTAFAAQVADIAVTLTAAGRVRLASGGVFTVAWQGSALAGWLGFGADLAGAAVYEAPLHSPLWWSPGKPALFERSPRLTDGQPVYVHHQLTAAYSGRAFSTLHGARYTQRLGFEKVHSERVMTAANLPGTWHRFFEAVALRSARVKVYDGVEETNAVTPFVADGVVGPYVIPVDKPWAYDRSQGFGWTDLLADITVDLHSTPEIGA